MALKETTRTQVLAGLKWEVNQVLLLNLPADTPKMPIASHSFRHQQGGFWAIQM